MVEIALCKCACDLGFNNFDFASLRASVRDGIRNSREKGRKREKQVVEISKRGLKLAKRKAVR